MGQKIDMFLAGVRCDLTSEAALAVSYAINKFSDIQSRNGAVSNDYTIPFTATNKAITKNAEQLNSGTTKPYVKIPCRIEENGIPQLIGYAQIKGEGKEGYHITVFGDNSDWFSLLEGLMLSDLDLSAYDHDWTFDNVVASPGNTYLQGYTYPNVDYGKLKDRVYVSGLSFDELYPWVYRKMLLLKIFSEIGYTLSGDFLSDPLFIESIIDPKELPLQHSEEWIEENKGELETSLGMDCRSNLVFSFPNNVFYFPTIINTGYNAIYDTESYYAPAVGSLPETTKPITIFKYSKEVLVKYRMQANLSNLSNVGGTIKFVFLKTTLPAITVLNEVRSALLSGSPITLIDPSDQIYQKDLFYRNGITEIDIDFTTADFPTLATQQTYAYALYPRDPESTSVEVMTFDGTIEQIYGKEVVPGDTINLSANLPDIKQSEFIKELANEFNLMFTTNSAKKTLRIDKFEKVIAGRSIAKDWSKKLDLTFKPTTEFLFSDYAQSNEMNYKADDSDELLKLTPTFGNGKILISNEHLLKSKVAYEAPYASTKIISTFTGALNIPYVPFFKTDEKKRFSIWSADDTYFTTPVQDYVIFLGRYFRALINNIASDKPPLYLEGGVLKLSSDEWIEGTFTQFTSKNVFASNKPEPRVLVMDRSNLSSVKLLNPGSVATYTDYICNATFEPLRYDTSLLPLYYDGFTLMLAKLKFLKVMVRLNALDIGQLDHTIPVLLDVTTPDYSIQGYFYINSVVSHQSGSSESTEVELLRLPPKKSGVAMPMLDYSSVDYGDDDYN